MTIVRALRPEALPPASDRFVVVEASAGTGKTFFLEHRVVDLILAGAELGQILLVTFTDKAVAELRMRIRDLLDRLSRQMTDSAPAGTPCWEIDDAARARLRAAVIAFDHAPIFTIHGFCHRVLIEDAFAARRLFVQTQVADEVAFDAAFASLLRERFAREPADKELLGAFLESGRSVDDLRRLLLKCARTGAKPRAPYDPEAINALGEELQAALGTPEQRARVAVDGHGKQHLEGWLLTIGNALGKAPAGTPAARVLASIDQLRDVAKTLLGRLKKPAPPELADVLRRVAISISLGEAIATAFLPRVVDRLASDKAEQGQFDYDDMLELVHRALRDERGPELAMRLRARTPWVMIDEFQDTDPVQWNIFRSVWMHPDARGLVIVGDPKQAIYGFRGADVETYLDARNELQRNGATEVTLDVNRRSTAPLVDAINTILIGTFGTALLQGAIEYDKPVRSCGEVICDEGEPVTVFAMAGSGKEANTTALRTAIGVAIEQLRDAPPNWRGRNGEPPFSLGQVMVLTRSNSESAEIATALRARGLPCALVESDKLFETREASELADVLASIAAPRDRSVRLRALRTRYFDVPWADLMKVVDAPDHHPLIARLFDWAALGARRNYELLFRKLVEDSRFAERALVLGGGERALTNTWHLLELLLEEVARSRSDLHELVVQLRRWINDRSDRFDDRDVQRAETDADSIRVLTVHKAKGLEAPYVFLYGGVSPGPSGLKINTLRAVAVAGSEAKRVLVVDPQDPEIVRRLEAEGDAENQRLAYVALTRAQVRLYLPLYGDRTVKDRTMYQPIQRCLKPHLDPRRPLAASSRPLFNIIDVPVGAEELAPAPLDALAGFHAAAPPAVGELAPIDGVRGGLSTLSYTRLAHDLEAAAITPNAGEAPLEIDAAEFDSDDASGQVGPEDLPPGAASGLLLHDLLETADLTHARGADTGAWSTDHIVIDQLRNAARKRGIGARYLPHAARLVHATLTSPLQLVDGGELPALVAAPRLAREVEFSFPLPEVRAAVGSAVRGLVRGYIDVLVSWDDELWVLDYKSDVLVGENLAVAAAERAKQKYAVQARLYAIAADRLRGERRLAGLLFAFVRYGLVVPIRTTAETIAGWTDWLGGLADRDARDRTSQRTLPSDAGDGASQRTLASEDDDGANPRTPVSGPDGASQQTLGSGFRS
ncbi:MAG: Exodeoxyribonuclease [Myxococcales bacterium]|nr:Exodeoxyribonuclease [Myxococcales bacterium]